MSSSQTPRDNARHILGLACARYTWEAKKMVLLLKQGKSINKLSAEATLAFSDLGIIEPDQYSGQLKVSDDYEWLVRSLTVSGLSQQYPEGAKKFEDGKKKCHPRRSEDRHPMAPAPISGVQRIADSSDEEVEKLRTA